MICAFCTLSRAGFRIPDFLCVTADAYRSFLDGTGLRERIRNVYWADFIPFAHGIRLFGQVYNDRLKPDEPYEFVSLLTQTDMASLERNRLLEALA